MRRLKAIAAVLSVTALAVVPAAPALADHTDPRNQLAPTEGQVEPGLTRGEGTWEHLEHFQGGANPGLTGSGTDLEFWKNPIHGGIYGSFGTLGQANEGAIGQRILRLVRPDGVVKPRWVADHGSAHCTPDNTGVTGLQHDVQVGRLGRVVLLTDTTDAVGRCHDDPGGGIEIVDVTKIGKPTSKPREVHLVRFAGLSHTNTVWPGKPWIVFNNSSDFANRPWIDVMDMRSCYGDVRWTLAERRAACRPTVSRIKFENQWTQQRDQTTGELEPGSATCHDVTFQRGRLYCAALNATLIIDVRQLLDDRGRVRGEALPCTVTDGTMTGAKVTDCSQTDAATQEATGWKFLGTFHHPGRDCAPGSDNRSCNTNLFEPPDEGVAVSHEADPTADGRYMFVTDERGGGVIPPGSTCDATLENPVGNGGAHAFDISDPTNIKYARTPSGEKAVYISQAVVSSGTFCDIHVIEHFPGEQRFIAAYYSQGLKIVDYFIDGDGNLQFEEVSSYYLPEANTWAAEHFKIQSNPDGTKTYFIATNDINRGIDVVSWTAEPNPIGATPPANREAMSNAGMVGISAAVLGMAALYRRRRAAAEEE